MTVAALSTAVQARVGSQWLIQITNDDASATSINTTRLDAACQDAIGAFEAATRMTHDTSNNSHLQILVKGVLGFLETYKSREGAMLSQHMKAFYAGCGDLEKRIWVTPSTTSNVTPTREATGSTPDMDRSKQVWKTEGNTFSPQETFSE